MGYTCPYCNMVCFDDGKIKKTHYVSHEANELIKITGDDENSALVVELSLCPNCKKTAVNVAPYWKNKDMKMSLSYPPAGIKPVPDYVPEAVRSDYMETVAIADLSPKASATLARRCLQGMIHDFWGIKLKNLNQEISALQGKVPDVQWKAIDGLRKLGNIGAHMEKDVELIIEVDPDEAKKLIKLIELLIQKWYVARHDEEQLLADITNTAGNKEAERKSGTRGK